MEAPNKLTEANQIADEQKQRLTRRLRILKAAAAKLNKQPSTVDGDTIVEDSECHGCEVMHTICQ